MKNLILTQLYPKGCIFKGLKFFSAYFAMIRKVILRKQRKLLPDTKLAKDIRKQVIFRYLSSDGVQMTHRLTNVHGHKIKLISLHPRTR